MVRLVMMLMAALVMSTAGSAAHASSTMQTFPEQAGAGPHDVYPAPDGAVWFTAQSAGKLGRLDSRTGRSDLIALGPGAAPHGVIVGPDGAPWVTEGGQNAIARVDPATHGVKLFPLPKSAATPTSTRQPSIARACSGSPGKTASTAGSIPSRVP
jgi:virginiamycin B lyase